MFKLIYLFIRSGHLTGKIFWLQQTRQIC